MTPLALPDRGPSKQRLEILRMDAAAPETSGAMGGVQLGLPRWEMRLTLGDGMSREDSDAWVVLLDRLRGMIGRVFVGDYKRPFPARYLNGFAGMMRASGPAFDGTATSWSLNSARDAVELLGLPSAFVLTARDLGAFEWETGGEPRRHLVRFMEAGTASGGGAVTLAIEPPVPGFVPVDAVFNLAKPSCIMAVVEKNVADEDRRGKISGTTLRLVQDIRQ